MDPAFDFCLSVHNPYVLVFGRKAPPWVCNTDKPQLLVSYKSLDEQSVMVYSVFEASKALS